MKKPKISLKLKSLIKQIIAVDVALISIATVMALFLNQYFGLVLFELGLVASILGSFLGKAPPYRPHNLELSELNRYERLVEKTMIERLHYVKQAAPFYGFENEILFAGVIAIFVGLLILFV